MKPYPLLFTPVYKDYLWGGEKIAKKFKRNAKGTIAESWEISERPEGMSIVTNGCYKGESLFDLADKFPQELIGENTKFPLLFKILDANKNLSMQVHPNNENAHRTNGEPKSEMWIILAADPDAAVYVGWNSEMNRESVTDNLANHTLVDKVCRVPVKPLDTVYIPGGTIHAVGKGCLIYEVQQTSNTTYRLYDWDRVDSHGNQRELHIKEGLEVLDFHRKEHPLVEPKVIVEDSTLTITEKVSSPFFVIRHCDFNDSFALDIKSFMSIFVIDGLVKVTCGGSSVVLNPGSSVLIPACAQEVHFEPVENHASAITTTLP